MQRTGRTGQQRRDASGPDRRRYHRRVPAGSPPSFDTCPPADRLLPSDPTIRSVARELLSHTQGLPIISPHGHVDAAVLAEDRPFDDPAIELITQDHYVLRMLHSQGIAFESLGRRPLDGSPARSDGRDIWRTFAEHLHLFAGTPSRIWFEHTLEHVLGWRGRLSSMNADDAYDHVVEVLGRDSHRPRSLYDRFGIGALATTDAALDELGHHAAIRASGWDGVVVPTLRPDDVVDPDRPNFSANLDRLAESTGRDTSSWSGYLDAIRQGRRTFIAAGATATDHGPPTARTADLDPHAAARLFDRVRATTPSAEDAELFRAQMLTELASMSVEDGLVMQLHAGSWRNHDPAAFDRFGPDVGADIPTRMDYVGALKPLLDRFGNDRRLTLVVYTLDESTYSRELAPLAGYYPALRLGPAWWFHDSPEGMRRYRRLVTETAGFHNTVGFNDDARSLLTIPARHDMARRIDAGVVAEMLLDGRIHDDEAFALVEELAVGLAARTFRLGDPTPRPT